MTQTLTTDRLKQITDAISAELHDYESIYDSIKHGEIAEMARELLANREAQPVQVTDGMALDFHHALTDGSIGSDELEEIKVGLRAALCNVTAQPAPAVPDDYQHLKNVQELYHSQEERLFSLAQRIKGASFDKYSHSTAQAIDVLEREIFGDDGDACRAAMLENIDKPAPQLDSVVTRHADQPVSRGYKLEGGENCWSCGKHFTYVQHSECDGYCPHCGSPVDIDDEEDHQSKVVPSEPTEEMISSVSGRRRITFEVSDHIFEQIKANCSARRPGKESYSVDEYFELLAVQDINQLKRQLAELASHKCQCGESMPGPAGGCYRNGEAACGQTQIWRELMLKTL